MDVCSRTITQRNLQQALTMTASVSFRETLMFDHKSLSQPNNLVSETGDASGRMRKRRRTVHDCLISSLAWWLPCLSADVRVTGVMCVQLQPSSRHL